MDERSIENPAANPTDPSDMPDELEQAVRSDIANRPVEGADGGSSAGSSEERVSGPGEGLVTEEGVNEPGTRADSDDRT